MSFEFFGRLKALEILQNLQPSFVGGGVAVTPKDQAEGVAEAVIRHQDLCGKGKITALGQLLQLATIYGMVLYQNCSDTRFLDYQHTTIHWP